MDRMDGWMDGKMERTCPLKCTHTSIASLVPPSLSSQHMPLSTTPARRLNEAQCVDATRVGNLAHVLNHSCDPNCYSRTVSIRDPASGTLRDHVVIFAKV
eukprot:362502-Chlamydomonas_euryale.AAC.6